MPFALQARAPFELDLRALGACRIALGSTLLLDLALRARFLEAHYTAAGAVPYEVLRRPGIADPAEILDLGPWSLLAPHLWNDSLAYQLFLFILAALAAGALILGYRTKIATVVSWTLLVSLHSRNPLVLNGGDELLRALLFWGIFLPWGERLALGGKERGPGRTFSVATIAFVLQVAVLFFFAGVRKSGLEWTSEGTAIFLALNHQAYRGPLADLVLSISGDAHGPLHWLSRSVRWCEILAPLLLLLPFRSVWLRWLGLAVLGGLLVGFLLGMNVGLFPWIGLCALVGLWQGKTLPSDEVTAQETPQGFVRYALLIFLLPMLLWNIAAAGGTVAQLPLVIRAPALLARLDQDWNMFTPGPPGRNAWLTAPTTLANGKRINSLRPLTPDSFERPLGPPPEIRASRWRKLALERIALGGYPADAYARWICRRWNQTAAPENRAEHLRLVLHEELILLRGGLRELPSRTIIETPCTQQPSK